MTSKDNISATHTDSAVHNEFLPLNLLSTDYPLGFWSLALLP